MTSSRWGPSGLILRGMLPSVVLSPSSRIWILPSCSAATLAGERARRQTAEETKSDFRKFIWIDFQKPGQRDSSRFKAENPCPGYWREKADAEYVLWDRVRNDAPDSDPTSFFPSGHFGDLLEPGRRPRNRSQPMWYFWETRSPRECGPEWQPNKHLPFWFRINCSNSVRKSS